VGGGPWLLVVYSNLRHRRMLLAILNVRCSLTGVSLDVLDTLSMANGDMQFHNQICVVLEKKKQARL